MCRDDIDVIPPFVSYVIQPRDEIFFASSIVTQEVTPDTSKGGNADENVCENVLYLFFSLHPLLAYGSSARSLCAPFTSYDSQVSIVVSIHNTPLFVNSDRVPT